MQCVMFEKNGCERFFRDLYMQRDGRIFFFPMLEMHDSVNGRSSTLLEISWDTRYRGGTCRLLFETSFGNPLRFPVSCIIELKTFFHSLFFLWRIWSDQSWPCMFTMESRRIRWRVTINQAIGCKWVIDESSPWDFMIVIFTFWRTRSTLASHIVAHFAANREASRIKVSKSQTNLIKFFECWDRNFLFTL